MCLAVASVNLLGGWVELISVCFESCLYHADASLGEYAALEGCVCLQAYGDFVVLVDVACSVSVNRLWQFLLSVIHAFFSLYLEHLC